MQRHWLIDKRIDKSLLPIPSSILRQIDATSRDELVKNFCETAFAGCQMIRAGHLL